MQWLKRKPWIGWSTAATAQPARSPREIDYCLHHYPSLYPTAYLCYNREAYFARKGDLRITFDDTILCRQEELSLLAKAYGEPLLPPDITLMEIKCNRRTAAVDDTYALPRAPLPDILFQIRNGVSNSDPAQSTKGGLIVCLKHFFRCHLGSGLATDLHITDFLLCLGCALVLGLVMSFAFMFHTRYTKSFVVTLALLPAVVCVIILMVNGNVGTGVAVAGTFSLVRFRSIPGTSREICMLFLAMGTGLITGMGYLGYAVLFTLILCAAFCLYNWSALGEDRNAAAYKVLSGIIPEGSGIIPVSLTIFLMAIPPVAQLVHVKTTSMGQPVSSDLPDPAAGCRQRERDDRSDALPEWKSGDLCLPAGEYEHGIVKEVEP